jgi:hypothetical protein
MSHCEKEQFFVVGMNPYSARMVLVSRGRDLSLALGISLLRALADLGHVDAQYRVGECFFIAAGTARTLRKQGPIFVSRRTAAIHSRGVSVAVASRMIGG